MPLTGFESMQLAILRLLVWRIKQSTAWWSRSYLEKLCVLLCSYYWNLFINNQPMAIIAKWNKLIDSQGQIHLAGFAQAWKVLENEGLSWKVLENIIRLEKYLKIGHIPWKVFEFHVFSLSGFEIPRKLQEKFLEKIWHVWRQIDVR